MARIAGVDLPSNKRLDIALTYIYGIGRTNVLKVLKERGFFFIRQKGSHARFSKPGDPTRNVTIKTTCNEIPYGAFQSILLQSGLKKEDFFE